MNRTGERPIGRAVVITGPESVLVDREASAALDSLRRAHPDRDVKHLECARKADPATGMSIADEVVQSAAPSLFGDPPILVVHDIDQADESGVSAVKDALLADDGPPIIVTHNGSARGRGVVNAATKASIPVVKCARPNERDIRALMRAEAKAAGGRITDRAEHWLIESLGTQSLELLLAAVRQAVGDSADGTVEETQVQAMFPGQAKVSSFQVADHVWSGAVADATRLLRVMEQRERGVGVAVVAALAHGLRMMALAGVRGAHPPADLNLAPWQVDRARDNARRWNATGARIAALAVALPALDAEMKGGLDGGIALDDEQKMATLESVVAKLAQRPGD